MAKKLRKSKRRPIPSTTTTVALPVESTQPVPAEQSRPGIVNRFGVWIVAVLAVAVYANTFTADFTLDDLPIIKENKLITSLGNLPKLFKTNYWGESEKLKDKGLYRPLTVASYALNYAVHGLQPAGYHVVNVALHALVSVLLFLLVKGLFDDSRVAFVAAVLFAVHPIHTEAVSNVVGRAEVLALLGTLACCWAYVRAMQAAGSGNRQATALWLSFSVVSYLAGMFSKEIGVIAPAAILLGELLLPKRRWLLRGNLWGAVAFAGYALAVVVYFLMRSQAIIAKNISVGFVGVSPEQRILTALRVCLEYVGLLVAPVRLSADYWVTEVPIAKSLWEPEILGAVLLLLAAIAFVVWGWRRFPGACWGIGFFAIALFPVSNLPFAIGVMKAERILYSPSTGFVVAFAALLPPLWNYSRTRAISWVLVGALAALFCARTWVRNYDWHDSPALATATLRTSPDSPIFNLIMGGVLREQNQNELARVYYVKALEGLPDDTGTIYNLGNIELDVGRYDAAIAYYNRVLRLDPNYAGALNNLGLAYMKTGQLTEATQVFDRLRQLRPSEPAAYMNLVSAYVGLNDGAAALPIAEEAVRRFPNEAGTYQNLGAVYTLLGRTNDAQQALARAAAIDPTIVTRQDYRRAMD